MQSQPLPLRDVLHERKGVGTSLVEGRVEFAAVFYSRKYQKKTIMFTMLTLICAFVLPFSHPLPKGSMAVVMSDTYWETLPNRHMSRVMQDYFDVWMPTPSSLCDVFYVYNIPAAVLLYNDYTTHGTPIVTDVFLNKGLLLVTNTSNTMRQDLQSRYQSIDMKEYISFCQIP